jgi:hypothetical protein
MVPHPTYNKKNARILEGVLTIVPILEGGSRNRKRTAKKAKHRTSHRKNPHLTA